MGSVLPTTVLASYSSRDRVIRDKEGSINLFWGALRLRMNQSEFLGFSNLVANASGCANRCGELAASSCGQAFRCPMGQIMLSHGNLTLWFYPEEFEKFCRLISAAQRRLADIAPLPRLGMAWTPPLALERDGIVLN